MNYTFMKYHCKQDCCNVIYKAIKFFFSYMSLAETFKIKKQSTKSHFPEVARQHRIIAKLYTSSEIP